MTSANAGYILTYLYNVEREILSVLQISSISRLLSACNFFANTTLASLAVTLGRPPLRPRARAAASPAFVRSWISRRSNWAKAEKMLKISSPDAEVVSIAPSFRERKLPRKHSQH